MSKGDEKPGGQAEPPGPLLAGREPSDSQGVRHAERLTDSLAAEPGESWDAVLSAVFEGSDSYVEYDLGRVRRIRAAWLQGDNNDRYVVSVSKDGASFEEAWVVPIQPKPGLRDRQASLDVPARYVRVAPGEGDGPEDPEAGHGRRVPPERHRERPDPQVREFVRQHRPERVGVHDGGEPRVERHDAAPVVAAHDRARRVHRRDVEVGDVQPCLVAQSDDGEADRGERLGVERAGVERVERELAAVAPRPVDEVRERRPGGGHDDGGDAGQGDLCDGERGGRGER